MNDERIERALRQGPLDEPEYRPGVRQRIASERDRAGAEAASLATGAGTEDRGLERVRPRVAGVRRPPMARHPSLPLGIAAALAILVGGLLLSPAAIPDPAASAAPSPDLLARLHASGTVRIAVSNGPPQTTSAGGVYIGFDIDVAEAIAERLGLRADITALAGDDMGSATWDLALPSSAGTPQGGSASEPYGYWPIWLVARPGSLVTDLASLASSRVCVVPGSAGAVWLSGGGEPGDPRAPAGADVGSVEAASDAECVAALADGDVDAMLTVSMLTDDVAARGLVLVIPAPVAWVPWTVAVRGTSADTAAVLDAVNRAIDELRAAGRLVELSGSSFGGQDVTVRQP